MNIEYDVKEILLELNRKFDKFEAKIDFIAGEVTQIKIDLARSTAEIKGEIRTLDEKVDGLAKRVDTQEFINRGVIIGLILAVLGSLAKMFGSNP